MFRIKSVDHEVPNEVLRNLYDFHADHNDLVCLPNGILQVDGFEEAFLVGVLTLHLDDSSQCEHARIDLSERGHHGLQLHNAQEYQHVPSARYHHDCALLAFNFTPW